MSRAAASVVGVFGLSFLLAATAPAPAVGGQVLTYRFSATVTTSYNGPAVGSVISGSFSYDTGIEPFAYGAPAYNRVSAHFDGRSFALDTWSGGVRPLPDPQVTAVYAPYIGVAWVDISSQYLDADGDYHTYELQNLLLPKPGHHVEHLGPLISDLTEPAYDWVGYEPGFVGMRNNGFMPDGYYYRGRLDSLVLMSTVPEPSSLTCGLIFLACGGVAVWRARGRRASRNPSMG